MKENMDSNMPENREGLKILEMQEFILKNEQEIEKVDKSLKKLMDDLLQFTNILRNEEEQLTVAKEDNILVKNEPEKAEVLDITMHTEEEIKELKKEIEKTKILLYQTEQQIDASNDYKTVLQSRINYNKQLEDSFKKALVKIKPERLN